jgi:hypothetical protein
MARAMASFEDVRRELRESCDFLQLFTQGHRGFTQQDGRAATGRTRALCAQLETDFASGPHAADAKTAVASAREVITEAEARLGQLRQ